MADLQKLYDAILNGNFKAAREVTQQAIAEGMDPSALVHDTMIPAMNEVGRRYEANEYFVPELLIAARAMKASLELIRPLLAEKGTEPVGRVVIGTVQGDLHDIGKNLVAAMLEGAGFEVVNLGVNVTADQFVAAAQKEQADILAASALLTTAMMEMRKLVQAVEQAGLRPRVRVILGGAPITREFAQEVGADGYGVDSAQAVELARSLVQENRRSAA